MNDPTKEFDYMLSEIEHERHAIDERRRRLEQTLTLYLSMLTAVIGGVIVLAVSTNSANSFQLVLACSALLVAVVGHLVFLSVLGITSTLAEGHSYYYARRQYFLDTFPKIRRYIVHRTDVRIQDVWAGLFSRTTRLALRLFAGFNCLLVGVFVFVSSSYFITLMQRRSLIDKFDVNIPAIILSLIVFALLLAYETRFIARRIRQVKDFCSAVAESLAGAEKKMPRDARSQSIPK